MESTCRIRIYASQNPGVPRNSIWETMSSHSFDRNGNYYNLRQGQTLWAGGQWAVGTQQQIEMRKPLVPYPHHSWVNFPWPQYSMCLIC
jgi:hypothetical protein